MSVASANPESPPPNDAVLQALHSARYNELVHLEVTGADDDDYDDDDAPVRDICLAACLDEVNGGITWNPLTVSEADATNADNPHPTNHRIQRHLRTKRWVLPMLNDRRRNDRYGKAIAKAVDQVARMRNSLEPTDPAHGNKKETRDVTVLDIGSGSGLLSMMAARSVLDWRAHDESPRTTPPFRPSVVAVEMSSAMADLSRTIVRDNQLEDFIRVVNIHSSQLELLPHDRRADLCVSELLESGLLGEGLLPSVRDAWDRLLTPDAVIVPASVRVYAAAVQQSAGNGRDNKGEQWIANYHPSTLCNRGNGVGWKALFDDDDDRLSRAVVVPVHATKLLREDHLRLLTDPVCVLTIHLDKDRIPSERGQRHQLSVPVTTSGLMQGFLVWWEMDLWKGDDPNDPSITYSMDPRDETVPFQDHWQQCLHVLPQSQNLLRGDTINILASHDDTSVHLDLLPSGMQEESQRKRSRIESPQPAPFPFSHERIFQLADPVSSQFLQTAIANAISSFTTNNVHVLDLSDFGLCGLFAALHGDCGRVTCLESAGGPMAEWTSRVAQASNLAKTCPFEILACHAEQLDRTILGGSVPHVVVAEPYYQVLEGWHLQEALNYYYLVRSLRRRYVLERETISVPSVCRIMACGIESHQLRESYSPCGDDESSNVCGFDHSELNRNACVALNTLSLSLWQYEHQRLTDDVEIGRLDYNNPREGGIRSTTTLSFSQAGSLDAFMIWLEYGYGSTMPASESSRMILSTNARSYRQGVRTLKRPVQVINSSESTVVVRVDFAAGGLHGSEDHTMDIRVEEGSGNN